MNKNDPYLTHLATLAVSLYPKYIKYWQESRFGEAPCGSLTSARIFLRNYLPKHLRESLKQLGELSGREMGRDEVLHRIQDVLAMMDIFAQASAEPEFLKHCEITHPDCAKLAYVCAQQLCIAQNHLAAFPDTDGGKDFDHAPRATKELLAEEEYQLWENCTDMGLELSPDCLHAVMLAALLLTERRERCGGYSRR